MWTARGTRSSLDATHARARYGPLCPRRPALAAALGTATHYPLQSSIAEVAGSLACGPAGYLAGLAALVPLVDRFPPRRVAAQFAALACAVIAVATRMALPATPGRAGAGYLATLRGLLVLYLKCGPTASVRGG